MTNLLRPNQDILKLVKSTKISKTRQPLSQVLHKNRKSRTVRESSARSGKLSRDVVPSSGVVSSRPRSCSRETEPQPPVLRGGRRPSPPTPSGVRRRDADGDTTVEERPQTRIRKTNNSGKPASALRNSQDVLPFFSQPTRLDEKLRKILQIKTIHLRTVSERLIDVPMFSFRHTHGRH